MTLNVTSIDVGLIHSSVHTLFSVFGMAVFISFFLLVHPMICDFLTTVQSEDSTPNRVILFHSCQASHGDCESIRRCCCAVFQIISFVKSQIYGEAINPYGHVDILTFVRYFEAVKKGYNVVICSDVHMKLHDASLVLGLKKKTQGMSVQCVFNHLLNRELHLDATKAS